MAMMSRHLVKALTQMGGTTADGRSSRDSSLLASQMNGDATMFKKMIKTAMVGLFVLSMFVIPACSQNEAEPQAMTGDSDMQPTHQRHATGIETQAAD